MSTTTPPDLGPGHRFGRLVAAWALLFGATPGFVFDDGSLVMGVVGLALWGATILRPWRGVAWRNFLAEYVTSGVGAGSWLAWTYYVYPGAFLWVVLGSGVYWIVTGSVVRRLSRRLPVTVAVATGVLAMEGLRALLPPPFGLGWQQFGHLAHHHLWISRSARFWGLEGLSLVVVSLGGLGAALIGGPQREAAGEPRLRPSEVIFGLWPLALALMLSIAAPERGEREGPLVLLVQPGFTQERKQFDPKVDNFADELALTEQGVAALVAAGTPPDLVLWAESMLYVPLFEPEVREALEAGVGMPSWSGSLSLSDLEDYRTWEDNWVRGPLLGEGPQGLDGGVLPDGTAFLSGTEAYTTVGEGPERAVRRRVTVALYHHPADGRPGGRDLIHKRHLVPGAESLLGFERLEVVRRVIMDIASYVPDFAPAEGPGILSFTTREGHTWRFGASLCFDNAFLDTFVDVFGPSGGGGAEPAPLDFHVVASNEAWYRTSFEMDQMVAFSRIAALATERAVVRVTNSGVSLVIGADGVERGRIRDAEGRDRAVRGTLALRVPVPEADARSDRSPYVQTRPLWVVLGLLSPLLALLVSLLGKLGRDRRGLGYLSGTVE